MFGYAIRHFTLISVILLAACLPEDDDDTEEANVTPRAVKTLVAEARPAVQLRRFPSVLEPPQLVSLSFEVGGRVEEVDLRVGQQVSAGELLATIEPIDLDLRLSQAEAALQEARAAADSAAREASRQEKLLERGVTTGSERDQAVAVAEQTEARLIQSQRNVDILRKSRSDADLRAPFSAVINSVDIQDFVSVQAGQPVVTLYQEGTLQASILVSFDVVRGLKIGDVVEVAPTDGDLEPLQATVAEIGRRAPAVSSFPVIVRMSNADASLRSGMAVEVRVETHTDPTAGLIPLPLSAINTNTSGPFEGQPPFPAEVYVYVADDIADDIDGGTLEVREISVAAAAENEIFVSKGLEVGDRVVTAGVPFLRQGQPVRLFQPDATGGE
ncbi:MAG: efflux RND transporter periplasmic adaptor subunit [Rhodobacteraceae bacterium]|nr:efflux RND transporter periplasmic adaptor subunit [Paracoccaceae bacterium]